MVVNFDAIDDFGVLIVKRVELVVEWGKVLRKSSGGAMCFLKTSHGIFHCKTKNENALALSGCGIVRDPSSDVPRPDCERHAAGKPRKRQAKATALHHLYR